MRGGIADQIGLPILDSPRGLLCVFTQRAFMRTSARDVGLLSRTLSRTIADSPIEQSIYSEILFDPKFWLFEVLCGRRCLFCTKAYLYVDR